MKYGDDPLTHSFPMHPFSTPWKRQKTLRFSDVFRGERKGALGTNGLIMEEFSPAALHSGRAQNTHVGFDLESLDEVYILIAWEL